MNPVPLQGLPGRALPIVRTDVFSLWPGQQHSLGSRLAARLLRAAGWTALLATPPGPKFIAAAAPHTSNADFWPGLFWKWSTRIPLHFVAKRELFRFPIGVFMRAVGGMPWIAAAPAGTSWMRWSA